ncbi:protein kinase [Myxococcus stipitatus]|uniref:serine/threonine-protein kinase n=1 Tax=Myxococcus stipitatus TaxID=83455 RepID=UPI001F22A767|nr:serine/threonine-protein kinase [Myxococcus stipitatus]MCE9667551.1 protein kinase [Myxococcus stipitatus]
MEHPPEGLYFGKYKLLERIATGGMAEIYRARMTAAAGVTKPVVIKKILPGYEDQSAFVSMFVNEARIAVELSHGNIAQVFDFGEVDGQYFIAMEWVDGHPLSRVLRRAREKGLYTLPQPLALLVMVEVLKGLAYAHTRLDDRGRPLRIIHRDVSPQNVLLSYEGQVKLVDFGIARARLASGAEPDETDAKGKYAYFAPEQARGRELDARTDIFAAGTVLYEALCGRLPFEGSVSDVMRKIALGDFPRPRELQPDIPPALERILLTALAVERDQRYPTAEAFAEALTRYLHTASPDVSTSALGHFMGYLFETELVADGRPVLLPREFLAQMSRWSRGAAERRPTRTLTPLALEETPPAPPPASAPQRAAAPGEGRRERTTQPIPAVPDGAAPAPAPAEPPPATTAAPRPAPVVPVPLAPGPTAPTSSRLPRAVMLGAPVLAAVMASLAVTLLGREGTFSVELSSSPPGAAIRVDGRPLESPTPALITHLAADGEHLLEVVVPGMVPWSQVVRAEHGTTLAVHARLHPRLNTSSTGGSAEKARGKPPLQDADMPVGAIRLSAVSHAFRVPTSQAVHVLLDPTRAYLVRVEGRMSLGGPSPVEEAAYFLEGDARLAAHDSFGILAAEEQLVRHTRVLHVFVPGGRGEDVRGALLVRIREQGGAALPPVRLDARHHAVRLSRADRFALHALDPDTPYDVVLRYTAEPARTRGPEGGPVGRVLGLMGLGRGPEDAVPTGLAVLEVGRPLRLRGINWLALTFPDDHLTDNTGTLLVEVFPAAQPPGSQAPGREAPSPPAR